MWLFTIRSYDLKVFAGSHIAEVYQAMIQEAHREFDGLYWLYVGDDYFTHYASADEDLSYISMKDPGPTVAERIPRYEPTYLTLI